MRSKALIILAATTATLASPMPIPQGTGTGADSCSSEALTTDTWTKLDINKVLADAAKNYTRTDTNNIQSLASSWGAPNFFCGLDNFCNAGQPCLPITTPAWYAAVAIQNWNNYMNSLNTAISFASSIVSYKLPSIVSDFYEAPKDDVTPLKNMISLFTTVIGVIPATGAIGVGVSGALGALNYAKAFLEPTGEDKFMAWSDISKSMGEVVQEYQAAVSDSIKAILDAKIDDSTYGINNILSNGTYLGSSQNFTQSELQAEVIDAITVGSISQVLQAQKLFIMKTEGWDQENAYAGDYVYTYQLGEYSWGAIYIARKTGDGVEYREEVTKKLISSYSMTLESVTKGVVDCFNDHGKVQLYNPLEHGVVTDRNTPCLFNLQVCELYKSNFTDYLDDCKNQGLDLDV